MSQNTMRVERDSMGEMLVPQWALWGAGTQRAVDNFPVSGRPLPPEIIHAYGLIKAACAQVNQELELLPAPQAQAIIAAAQEVAQGKLDSHFPVDVYQTGSGTSTNTNLNEVIANRVNQNRGLPMGSRQFVHPNDHVNMGQSSNDTFPTAMHLAAGLALDARLLPALTDLERELGRLSLEWDNIVKVGRTHLMDATPIRMGQVFSGYQAQIAHARDRCRQAIHVLGELAIGGTAVGTGLNTHIEFGPRVARALQSATVPPGSVLRLRCASNHFEAQATQDACVEAHGHIKTIAVSLTKIAGDLRLLGSGPRCGLGELQLPALQPGSSIMPGKVNPVIAESVIQVACRVLGNDALITTANLGGIGSLLELNVAMPVMADALLESIRLLAAACGILTTKLLAALEVNRSRCQELIEQSLMMVTSLAPVIGYDQAAKLAKQVYEKGGSIRELAREQGLLEDAQLERLLDPRSMTEPGGQGNSGV